MKNFWNRFLGSPQTVPSASHEQQDPRDIQLATCAILLEMAHIDGEFDEKEARAITQILIREFQLSENEVQQLMEKANAQLKKSIDLWHFTHQINEEYNREEKIHIMEMIWKVVYTDGTLDKHEDYLVHKLSNLLNLPNLDLIQAKLRVLERIKNQG